MESEYEANKERVVAMLIENCMKVDMEIPRVVKGKFD